jgi:glycosyltransferase involved in cell wall biosynthesis
LVHLPYFLPDDWTSAVDRDPVHSLGPARPYLAAAGRLVRMKGFHELIPVMKRLPEIDLRIAGTGPYEAELRRMAEGLPNVSFEGLLGGDDLSRLFRGALAVVVPSLFPETFGYVVLEAFAVRTPVVVQRAGGAIVETGADSGGGLAYSTADELVGAVRRLAADRGLRDQLAEAGYAVRSGSWSESNHLARYFELIAQAKSQRGGRPRPQPQGPSLPRPSTAGEPALS